MLRESHLVIQGPTGGSATCGPVVVGGAEHCVAYEVARWFNRPQTETPGAMAALG